MRLTKIKLAGFKSFVDPTVLDLKSNLVAVLGPNGCGKSNTIDAVRWVMGESSAKNLRGGQSVDVIFNGSSSRKPVGQATVELIFDNADGTLGGAYSEYAEISIKRQITRDGQSNYFINQTKCRRRDVMDLFLGTGLGPRSYAIIEQGMISRFIEAKPDDLRIYFEEAAGVSKYKERRRETESRMIHTRENLERLTDLRQEIEKQLHRLERQSEAARKFKDYQSEVDRLKNQWLVLQYQRHTVDLNQGELRIRDLSLQLEGLLARAQHAQTQIEGQRLGQAEAQEGLQRAQQAYYAVGGAISTQELALKHHQERQETLDQDLERAAQALERAKGQLQEDEVKLLAWQTSHQALAPQVQQQEAEHVLAQRVAQEAGELMDQWRLDWERFIEASQQPAQQAEGYKAQLLQLETHLRQVQGRQLKLHEEKENLDRGIIQTQLEADAALIGDKESQVQGLERELESLQARIQSTREQMATQEQALRAVQQASHQAKGKQASLQALQEAALAPLSAATQAWLKQQGFDHYPRLAQQLKVEPFWQKAVETVLQGVLSGLCLEQLEGVSQDLPDGIEGLLLLGQATALTAPRSSRPAEALRPLAETVQVGYSACSAWLAPVWTAADLRTALQALPQLAAHESIILPTGLWLGAHWIRLPQSEAAHPQQGVLAREQALLELQGLIEEQAQQEAELAATLGQLASDLRAYEGEREDQQRQRSLWVRELGTLKSNQSAQQARLEHMDRRLIQIEQDRQELRVQEGRMQAESTAARQQLDQAIEAMAQFAQKKEQYVNQKQQVERQLVDARRALRERSEVLQATLLEKQRLEAFLQGGHQNVSRFTQQVSEFSERLERLSQERIRHAEPLPQLRQGLEQLLAERLQAEAVLTAARQGLGQIEALLQEWEAEKTQAIQQQERLRGVIENAKMDWQAASVKRQGVEEQLERRMVVLADIQESLPPQATESEWQAFIEEMEGRIERLGAINLAAIEEFAAEKERKEYLDAQDADLNEALALLESAIQKIDAETKARFQETFEKVNQAFKSLFPRLFGGGEAFLALTGDDLLSTGITMMARPPGKKNSLLSQLSGGEKALTAVALVFAIFELNPAPFCMLDEVDAPLDDANVGRFCKLVKELSEQVQFIYITHNKVTMEMADYLMGVTMKEPGVSRLVSVDLEEAVGMAEA